MRDGLRAEESLTKDAMALASLKEKEIKVEADKQRAQLQGLLDDKTFTDKAARADVQQAIDQSRITEDLQIKANLQARDTAMMQDAIADQEKISAIYSQIAADEASRAQTVRERLAIEKRDLAHRQMRELSDFDLRAADDLKNGRTTGSAIARDRNAILDRQAMESNQLYDPVRAGFKSAILGAFEAARGGAGGLAKYFGDQLRQHLLDTLATNLANILTDTLRAGSAGGNPGGVLGLISAGAKLFGFADGGRPPVGQASWVGERGRELFIPDTPGTIVPNHMLAAPASPSRAGGGIVVIQPLYFDAKGAVMTEQLVNQMNTNAVRAATQMGQVLRATLPAQMQQRASRQLRR